MRTLAIEERTRVEVSAITSLLVNFQLTLEILQIASVNVTLQLKDAENTNLRAEIAALKASLALRNSEQEMATTKPKATGDPEAADSSADASTTEVSLTRREPGGKSLII